MHRGDGRAFLVGAAGLIAIGLLDYLTPSDVDFSLFYMLLVVLVAWLIGWKAGIGFALVSVITAFIADSLFRQPAFATAAWNGLSRFAVLSGIAIMTDRVYVERVRWKRIDAEREMLLRVLEREIPRPLRAIEWFVRTFEEVLERQPMEGLRTQFTGLQHHVRELGFLTSDVLAVGRLHSGALPFDRHPIDLGDVVREAADETLARGRVMLQIAPGPHVVLADADRLRHAVASALGRALDGSPYETVAILVRSSDAEAIVEIECRGRSFEVADIELARLLVEGHGGHIGLRPRGGKAGKGGVVLSIGIPRTAELPVADAGDPIATRSSE